MQDNAETLNANKQAAVQDAASRIQLMTFIVADQEYAIDVMQVKEIKGWMPATNLPNTPEYVMGVINLRGAVVPIVDLRCRFGRGHCEPTKNHVVMIMMVRDRIMGMLVDAVSDIISTSVDEIRPIPTLDSNNDSDAALKGLINHDNRLVALLNIDRIFDQNFEIEEHNVSPSMNDVLSKSTRNGALHV